MAGQSCLSFYHVDDLGTFGDHRDRRAQKTGAWDGQSVRGKLSLRTSGAKCREPIIASMVEAML